MNPGTIIKTIKEASPLDLFLLSFLLLPFVVDAWLRAIERLEVGQTARYGVLIVVIIFYVLIVGAMLQRSSRARNRELARDQIIQYLTSKDFEMMSLKKVRKKINQAYTDKFLESLPEYFPNELRRAKLKGGKPGIARIIESEADEEG